MGSVIGSDPAVDPLLALAIASGEGVVALIGLLLLTIGAIRFWVDRRRSREKLLLDRWQPVFFHAVEGIEQQVPPMVTRDGESILMDWLLFTESIRGEGRARLVGLAHAVGLDRVARRLIGRRSVRQKLMGIVALGRMRETWDWALIAEQLTDLNPMVSLLSARSLLMIDTRRALPLVIRQIVHRDDWPRTKIAAMLADVPGDELAGPMRDALARVAPERIPRLLELVDVASLGDLWPLLEPWLAPDQPVDILVAALKACHDPRALDAARRLAAHEQWAVRAQAVAMLGRLGDQGDMGMLMSRLSDPEWWVRYRAAQALAAMPFMTPQRLGELAASLPDRYASEIVLHVLAERRSQQESG